MFVGTVSKRSERRLPAAATIDANADVLVLTGAVGVSNINPKVAGVAAQEVTLIAFDSVIVLAATGNIAVGVSLTVGRAARLTYVRATGKWHADLAAL